MVKIDENRKCELCGSAKLKVIITDDYHKQLIRICGDTCPNNEQVLQDYGYSEKSKNKLAKKAARTE